ncbi:ABC-type branched-chain amino acid transport systems, ATPase component [Salinarchaeum sp. Harcht-Bsk1]|uniref:ABC transporter ATP-binding protein n=1 Tax=Salinarchaeum sp. Harcht-Bsk1 TaxID=1333523 RepID=UPI00034230F0|nr:ABC transporter ATP-binding protein [Salinarchaeum sp. Harcht-Bsk1]AGN01309.1 ABC-type branched-chain amino acid transport systems, ATPase component [Salinarchaeum sp. Harcht-Bsk1]
MSDAPAGSDAGADPGETGNGGTGGGRTGGASTPDPAPASVRTVPEPEPPGWGDGEGDAILQIDGLRKTFGGITAVDDASFAVERGTITGLIGPNGAGKSTTFDLVTGFTRPNGGEVTFDGRSITGLAPHQIAQAGLVRTFQITREFPDMTVLENLMVAPKGQRGESLSRSVLPGARGAVVAQERELVGEIWEVLDTFEIDHLADEYARSLSGGQRKLLELARALLTEPELLLLDEPMAGVNPSLEEKLLERIHDLRAEGYSFLLVEHDMDLIMEHCDRVIVMHQGQVLAEGEPETIRENEAVIEAYLGGNV